MSYLNEEIISRIAKFSTSRTQARLKRTCRELNKLINIREKESEIIRKKRINSLRKYNPLWEIIQAFPDATWDMDSLSVNPCMLYDYLLIMNQHKPIDLDFEVYSKSPNLNLKIIGAHINEDWDWAIIGEASCMTPEFLLSTYPYFKTSDWYPFYRNKHLPKKFVEENYNLYYGTQIDEWVHLSWDFVFNHSDDASVQENIEHILLKLTVSDEIILKLQETDLYDELPEYQRLMITYHHTNLEKLDAVFINIYRNRDVLTMLNLLDYCAKNPDKLLEIVDKNPHNNWDFSVMHELDVSIGFIIKFIDRQWNFAELTKHKSITTEIILQNPTKNWNLIYFAEKFPITVDIIIDNPTFPWPKEIAANKYITWETIINSPTIKWDMREFCRNPNITLEIIKNTNLTPCFQSLSKNNFGF